jgi:branched-chain amino acid transport system substrate-binding protein
MVCRSISCLLASALVLASGSAQAEVKVGSAGALSGPFSWSGERNRIALELAARRLNDTGGVLGEKLALVAVDDACGEQRAVAAARELVAAGISLVVGHMCSHSSLLAAGIYETADVLMISPESTHPRLTEEGRRNVFRLHGRDDDQGRLAGDFLARHWPDAQIAIVHDGSVYGEGLAIQTRRQLRAAGGRAAVYAAYPPGAKDQGSLAQRLRDAAIEVLYVGGYGPDAARILRAVRARGLDLQLVGGDGLGMDEFWTVAGHAGEGTLFSTRPDPRRLPAAAPVLAAFEAQGFGTRSSGIATYAALEVWAQAVERAGSFELPAVARMLRRGRFDSVLGSIAFDDKGDLEGASWQWQRWSDGSYAPLDGAAPRTAQAPAAAGGPAAGRWHVPGLWSARPRTRPRQRPFAGAGTTP